jgi:hypothetical protein
MSYMRDLCDRPRVRRRAHNYGGTNEIMKKIISRVN